MKKIVLGARLLGSLLPDLACHRAEVPHAGTFADAAEAPHVLMMGPSRTAAHPGGVPAAVAKD